MSGPSLPNARLSRGLKDRLRRLEGLMRVQHVEGLETIAARRLEQDLCLLPIRGSNLFALDFRGFDGIAHVAGDQAVEHRLLERLAQYAVHLAHSGRRKAGVQLLTVETPHMGRIEVS